MMTWRGGSRADRLRQYSPVLLPADNNAGVTGRTA